MVSASVLGPEGLESRGSRNTPSRFMLQKPEISSGTDDPLGLSQLRLRKTVPYLTFLALTVQLHVLHIFLIIFHITSNSSH